MSRHHRFRLIGQRLFQNTGIYIILRNRHVHEDRYGPILDDRRNCRWKPRCHRDHLISPPDGTFSQHGRSKRHKCRQICRGSRIDHRTVFYSQILAQLALKSVGISACREPEFQCAVYQINHFIAVIHSGSIRNSLPRLKFLSGTMILIKIFLYKL